jgi:translation initiation factor IF-3
VDADGSMLGVLKTHDALAKAEDQGMDLVEISPNASPPVCRIMDFGKFQYDEGRKKKGTKKKQHGQVVKEIKFHANVAEHDYETKVNHIKQFLKKGFKIKLTLTFRGRENAHRELGFELIKKVLSDCEAISGVDMQPRIMGRSINAMISPKIIKKGE